MLLKMNFLNHCNNVDCSNLRSFIIIYFVGLQKSREATILVTSRGDSGKRPFREPFKDQTLCKRLSLGEASFPKTGGTKNRPSRWIEAGFVLCQRLVVLDQLVRMDGTGDERHLDYSTHAHTRLVTFVRTTSISCVIPDQ